MVYRFIQEADEVLDNNLSMARKWPMLPERDEYEHSQKSVRRCITPPCQNRVQAEDERKPAQVRPRVGGQRCQLRRQSIPLGWWEVIGVARMESQAVVIEGKRPCSIPSCTGC